MKNVHSKKIPKPTPGVLPESKMPDQVQTESVLKLEIIREIPDFQLKIHWLPSGKTEVLKGLSTDGLLDSIYQQLMQFDGNSPEKPLPEKKSPDLLSLSESVFTPAIETKREKQKPLALPQPKILQEIHINQQHPQFHPGKNLIMNIPFTVALRVHLPIVPTRENIDIDTPGFGIRLAISGNGLEKALIHEFTEDIRLGTQDYSNLYLMPQLRPGDYQLAAWVTVPFIRKREKCVEFFRVQDAGTANLD